VTLYLSRYILPEVLYPWLSVASGLLVVLIGLALLYRHLDKLA
jgi:nickel/cobalt transporter (NicO) family protein